MPGVEGESGAGRVGLCAFTGTSVTGSDWGRDGGGGGGGGGGGVAALGGLGGAGGFEGWPFCMEPFPLSSTSELI